MAKSSKEPALSIKALEKARPALLRMAPGDQVKAARFLHILQAQVNTPELRVCTPRSILISAKQIMASGLNPDGQFGHVFMIPRKNKGIPEATVQFGYLGLMELARRSKEVTNIRGELIYEKDLFAYSGGLEVSLTHVPYWLNGETEPGKMIGAYVVWEAPGGQQVCLVSVDKLESRRNCSQMKDKWAWVSHTDAMYLKTALREAARWWPLSPELAGAIAADDAADRGETQGTDADLEELLGATAAEDIIEIPSEDPKQ